MRYLRYAILALVLLNLAGAILSYNGSTTLSSIVSYLSYLLMILFYMLTKRGGVNKWMILIGLLYYTISLFGYNGELSSFATDFIKFFIVAICGYEVVKKTSESEFFTFLFLGCLTILLHVLVLKGGSAEYGRFSGFYINPNAASFICGSSYALSYALRNKRVRLVTQLIITLMGLLTLSRTFILTWIILNLISIRIDIKNVRIFGFGFIIIIVLLMLSEQLGIRNARIEQLKKITSNESVSTEEVNEGSRTETWSKYYEDIYSSLWVGSGFRSFQGNSPRHSIGVHNTYLLILGESGIVPIMVFLAFYLYLLISSISYFFHAPNLFFQLIVLLIFFAVAHVYFTHHFIILISMWIQYQLKKIKTNEIST